MADDIVTRLRSAAMMCHHGFPNGAGDSFPDPTSCGGCTRLSDAADEIDRLRDQVRWASDRASEWKLETYELNTEIERLLAAGDALYELVSVRLIVPADQHDDAVEQIRKWKEARRG